MASDTSMSARVWSAWGDVQTGEYRLPGLLGVVLVWLAWIGGDSADVCVTSCGVDAYAEAYIVSDEYGKMNALTVVTDKGTGSETEETTRLVAIFADLELHVCIRYSKTEIERLFTKG